MLKSLQKAGAEIVSVSLPSTHYALSAYYVIASAEASSNLARYSGIHYGRRDFTSYALSAKYIDQDFELTLLRELTRRRWRTSMHILAPRGSGMRFKSEYCWERML